jgi:hypothetical protein
MATTYIPTCIKNGQLIYNNKCCFAVYSFVFFLNKIIDIHETRRYTVKCQCLLEQFHQFAKPDIQTERQKQVYVQVSMSQATVLFHSFEFCDMYVCTTCIVVSSNCPFP